MSVRVSGGVILPSYQWPFDDGQGGGFVDIGDDQRSLTLCDVQESDAGDYRCVITGDDGVKGPVQLTSNVATITTLDRIRCAQQPVGGGVYVGGAFSVRVVVTGAVVGTLQ